MNWTIIRFTFPDPKLSIEPPPWASLVDRWYQLDAYSFGMAEMGWRLREEPKPELIILASEKASNASDHAFAADGGMSAVKFAHTLPNVRSSPFCQAMNWQGPILCLQRDPNTLRSAVEQAKLLSNGKPIWVVGVQKHPRYSYYRCYLRLISQRG